MLQKIKHILPLLLAALFLYPIIIQSVHVFEHDHQAHCCGSCSSSQEPIPVSSADDNHPHYQSQEDECSICNFHYAKLQVIASLVALVMDEHHLWYLTHNYPNPFVFFQGFIFSLRAPPLG